MKALVVTTLSNDLSGASLKDVARPDFSPGKVLVRVRAAALNYPDLLMTRGDYQLKPELPFVPGIEVAGEVIAGDQFVPGDAVVCSMRTGEFAEVVSVDPASVRRMPANLSFAQAASVGAAYLTAWVGLVRLARVRLGEWVLVHGATGGVGLAAVDLAQALGARVIATSRSPDKLAVVSGAYHPAATLAASGFRGEVKRLTGTGADIVFDPVGGDAFDESTRCIAFGGRLMVVGFTSGRISSVATNIPLIKGFSVMGLRAGEYARRYPDHARADRDAVWAMVAESRLRPRVHAEYPLADWRDAFAAMQASSMVGKLVLTF